MNRLAPPTGPTRQALTALVLAVLGLHLVLLWSLESPLTLRLSGEQAALTPLQVRVVTPPPAAAAALPAARVQRPAHPPASLQARAQTRPPAQTETVPADPKLSFDPAGINIYADSWRVDFDRSSMEA